MAGIPAVRHRPPAGPACDLLDSALIHSRLRQRKQASPRRDYPVSAAHPAVMLTNPGQKRRVTMEFEHLVLLAIINWQISLALILLGIMPAGHYFEVQLNRRFGFSMVNLCSTISTLMLCVAPGLLYLMHTGPCRLIGTLPLGWVALGMLLLVAAALAFHNIRNTTWMWGLPAALIQTAFLSLFLILGAVVPMAMMAPGGTGNGGIDTPARCYR